MSSRMNSRFPVVHEGQHILRHGADSISYGRDPSILTVSDALDYVFSVLYPQAKDSVANVAALPSVGNTINDYRVVLDDGDGKAAGYVWLQYEGEVSAGWKKRYDMDWGINGVLAQVNEITQWRFAQKLGVDDLDASGVAITGIYAGQRIWGGKSASTNLTLSANLGDGVGARTGFIQFDDHVRPTDANLTDLGDISGATKYRFRTGYFGTSLIVGVASQTTYGIRSISDSAAGQTFTFNDMLLTTTGSITSGNFIRGTTTYGQLSINDTDTAGAFSFNGLSVTTTSYIKAGNLKLNANTLSSENVNGNIVLDPNGIGIVDIQSNTTIAGTLVTTGNIDNGHLRLSTASLISLGTNENITIQPNGTGTIELVSATGAINITGELHNTGSSFLANLKLFDNHIQATNTNGQVVLAPAGTGLVELGATTIPHTGGDGVYDLGQTTDRWDNIYFTGSLGDGTTTIASSVIQSLRGINSGVSTGMTIFWSGTQWVPSIPDTEIDHGTLTGLSDDDHAQYALLAGRSSGQSLNGGTAASKNLTLDSTAHATKGSILIKSKLTPNTTAAYSAGWTGTDLGSSSKVFNDVYSAGEFKGFRVENFTGADPSASSQNVGRMIYRYDINTIKVDTGGSWSAFVSASAFLKNGNSFAADAYIGTNDAFDLYFERNNTAKARIVSTGMELVDGDLVFNYGAAGSGADWKATIRRPATGMTAAAIHTLPSATGTLINSVNKLSALASTTSAELAGVISDETGSGALVFGTSPTFTTDLTTPLIIMNQDRSVIRTNTSDGSDTAYLVLTGGGSYGNNRGALIYLAGNEQVSGNGYIGIEAGNVATALARIDFTTANTLRMTIQNDGVINLPYGQLKFPGSQNASADANTMDDFEEGTWTPTITFGGGSTGITYQAGGQSGTYQKIGSIVYFTAFIYLSSKGSSTGQVKITGLPFTTINSSYAYSAMDVGYFNALTSITTNTVSGYIDANNTYVVVLQGGTTGSANLDDTNFQNTSQLMVKGFYKAAS